MWTDLSISLKNFSTLQFVILSISFLKSVQILQNLIKLKKVKIFLLTLNPLKQWYGLYVSAASMPDFMVFNQSTFKVIESINNFFLHLITVIKGLKGAQINDVSRPFNVLELMMNKACYQIIFFMLIVYCNQLFWSALEKQLLLKGKPP